MIIADSGFWVALVNPDDKHHQIAVRILKKIDEPLITTYPVITEVCHLLLKLRVKMSMLSFVESYQQDALNIFQTDFTDESQKTNCYY